MFKKKNINFMIKKMFTLKFLNDKIIGEKHA